MNTLPTELLDVADAAHTARVAGHGEREISRAAGVPERRVAHPNDIVERILRQPVESLSEDDRAWWLVTVNQILLFAGDPATCRCSTTEETL